MRIRSIRPEFWSSTDIAAMDWHTRLVYIGLWSYVDDNGVGRDIERLIVAELFPLDEDLREASRRVTGALRYLSEHGNIVRYEVESKPYLHIVAWSRHQRIEKKSAGRYPLPTRGDVTIREHSGSTPGVLPEGSPLGEGEKGRRGEDSSSELRPDVDGLLDHLDDCIAANGAKVPSRTKANLNAARLLIDRDGRDPDEARQLITWATSDDFWRSNILSMVKFREKYDQLRLRSAIGHATHDDSWDRYRYDPDTLEGA